MKYSVDFKTLLPQAPQVDLEAINTAIASNANQIAESSKNAAWVQVWLTLVGSIFAAVAAISAWRALQTWRSQVVGEYELIRLIDAIQALHDLEIEIKTMRAPIIQTTSNTAARSKEFRENLRRIYANHFLKSVKGFDELWEPIFKVENKKLEDILISLEQSSYNAYEHPQRNVICEDKDRIAIGLQSVGLTDDIENFGRFIDAQILSVRSFLLKKLKKYSK